MIFSAPRRIILASGSPYRRALLDQIRLCHEAEPADIDESPLPGESPADSALRLAREKARAIGVRHARALVIGSDQVCARDDGKRFGKPGTHEAARLQLAQMSGRRLTFYTAVCVLASDTGTERCAMVPTEVQYRVLSAAAIDRYLHIDEPYDCAGSAKIERLGVTLVERVTSDDPSALIGLPLIELVNLLAAEGVHLP